MNKPHNLLVIIQKSFRGNEMQQIHVLFIDNRLKTAWIFCIKMWSESSRQNMVFLIVSFKLYGKSILKFLSISL